MKRIILIGFLAFSVFACETVEDPIADQKKEDREIIDNYISANGLSGSFFPIGMFKTVLSPGSSEIVFNNGDSVFLNINQRLLNGTLIKEGKENYQFNAGRQLVGIENAVFSMKKGEKARFIFPSFLSYGAKSGILNGVNVPSNAILIIELELLDTKPIAATIPSYLSSKNITASSTPSGLYYLVEGGGSGDLIKDTETVQVFYKGYFSNGVVFDKGPGPISFVVGAARVIKGWDEGLKYFRKGDKGKLFVPYQLGYGNAGNATIPPYAFLVFDIQVAP